MSPAAPDLSLPVRRVLKGEARLDEVARALDEGADPSKWKAPGSPLRAAVNANNTQLTKLLVAKGANVNDQDASGVGPLHMAVFQGLDECVQLLLEAGADANILDRHGQTPLFFAPTPRLCELLVKGRADVNARNAKAQSALHLAAHAGLVDIVKWFLANSSTRSNERDLGGRTPLMYASTSRTKSAVPVLEKPPPASKLGMGFGLWMGGSVMEKVKAMPTPQHAPPRPAEETMRVEGPPIVEQPLAATQQADTTDATPTGRPELPASEASVAPSVPAPEVLAPDAASSAPEVPPPEALASGVAREEVAETAALAAAAAAAGATTGALQETDEAELQAPHEFEEELTWAPAPALAAPRTAAEPPTLTSAVLEEGAREDVQDEASEPVATLPAREEVSLAAPENAGTLQVLEGDTREDAQDETREPLATLPVSEEVNPVTPENAGALQVEDRRSSEEWQRRREQRRAAEALEETRIAESLKEASRLKEELQTLKVETQRAESARQAAEAAREAAEHSRRQAAVARHAREGEARRIEGDLATRRRREAEEERIARCAEEARHLEEQVLRLKEETRQAEAARASADAAREAAEAAAKAAKAAGEARAEEARAARRLVELEGRRQEEWKRETEERRLRKLEAARKREEEELRRQAAEEEARRQEEHRRVEAEASRHREEEEAGRAAVATSLEAAAAAQIDATPQETVAHDNATDLDGETWNRRQLAAKLGNAAKDGSLLGTLRQADAPRSESAESELAAVRRAARVSLTDAVRDGTLAATLNSCEQGPKATEGEQEPSEEALRKRCRAGLCEAVRDGSFREALRLKRTGSEGELEVLPSVAPLPSEIGETETFLRAKKALKTSLLDGSLAAYVRPKEVDLSATKRKVKAALSAFMSDEEEKSTVGLQKSASMRTSRALERAERAELRLQTLEARLQHWESSASSIYSTDSAPLAARTLSTEVTWTREEKVSYLVSLNIVSLPGEEAVLKFLCDALEEALLPVPWVMLRDSQGRVCFANQATGEAEWNHPLDPCLKELAGAARVCLGLPAELRKSCIASLRETWDQHARSEFAKWYTVKHRSSGKNYYCHRETGVSMWEHPAEVVLPAYYLKLKSIERLLEDTYCQTISSPAVTRSLSESAANTKTLRVHAYTQRLRSHSAGSAGRGLQKSSSSKNDLLVVRSELEATRSDLEASRSDLELELGPVNEEETPDAEANRQGDLLLEEETAGEAEDEAHEALRKHLHALDEQAEHVPQFGHMGSSESEVHVLESALDAESELSRQQEDELSAAMPSVMIEDSEGVVEEVSFSKELSRNSFGQGSRGLSTDGRSTMAPVTEASRMWDPEISVEESHPMEAEISFTEVSLAEDSQQVAEASPLEEPDAGISEAGVSEGQVPAASESSVPAEEPQQTPARSTVRSSRASLTESLLSSDSEAQVREPVQVDQHDGCLFWEFTLRKEDAASRFGFAQVNGRAEFELRLPAPTPNISSPDGMMQDINWRGPEVLIVRSIHQGGLLHRWSMRHPEAEVLPQDRICAVNGESTVEGMQREIRTQRIRLRVMRYPEQFVVHLQKRGQKLGFRIQHSSRRSPGDELRVSDVLSLGALQVYNQEQILAGRWHCAVLPDMCIESANGVSGDASAMAEELKRCEEVTLGMRRNENSLFSRQQIQERLKQLGNSAASGAAAFGRFQIEGGAASSSGVAG